MENMIKITELLMIFLSLTGAIGISYVESKIMSRSGHGKQRGPSFTEIYWHNLPGEERLLFWSSAIFLLSSLLLPLLL